MNSALVLLLGVAAATALPSATNLYTISLAELQQAVATGRTANINRALHNVGAIAVSGLGARYAQGVESLRVNNPNCLKGSLRVKLTDGVERFSHIQSNNEEPPRCIKTDYEAILDGFNTVEAQITEALGQLVGNSSLLVKENMQIKKTSQLETKTHVHTYINKDTVQSEEITNPYSLPFHQDNGLWLLMTPADVLPVVMKTRAGQLVSTEQLSSDTAMFLVGRGLTDWLLQDTTNSFIAPPHAVQSLAGSGIAQRTVMARMKIAEYDATPALTGGLTYMESLELHESICPLAAAGHYSPGGPLSEEEAKDDKKRAFLLNFYY